MYVHSTCHYNDDNMYVYSNLLALAATNQDWYTMLTSGLTPEQTEKVKQLFVTAEQKKAARGTFSTPLISLLVHTYNTRKPRGKLLTLPSATK